MKTNLIILLSALLLVSCKNKSVEVDAYGNFESTEVIVSAETNGRIFRFMPVEGSVIEKGDEIAIVDTTLYLLQQAEIDASIKSVKTRIGSIEAQNDILNQQIANLNINIKRIENMLKDDAATKKQYDDLTGQTDVIRKQIAANNAQKVSTAAEITVLESRKATVKEQISRCYVRSPLKGTVIEKYSEMGEMTAAGKPMVKVADMTIIKLKVYVSGAQLGKVKLGQDCTIRIDDGKKGYRSFKGRVSFVSEKAEFTPKIIQTKDERVTLVYGVKIEVLNDGSLKAGMPGEAIF
jgi:HlyD family secretion protein